MNHQQSAETSYADVEHEHRPAVESVRQKSSEERTHDYLGDAILGGIDGAITTFAVVSGAIGGGFSTVVIIVLGFANLLADGFSMGVSNYLGKRSDLARIEEARRSERRQIDEDPAEEREEIRQIFANKGFEGQVLEEIVDTIAADRQLWVKTMLIEELGLQIEQPRPWRSGAATFLAFLVVGLIPLVPFLLPVWTENSRGPFIASIVATAIAFLAIGVAKGAIRKQPLVRSALETLLIGGGAATLAYFVGSWLRQTYGTGVA